MDLTGMITLNPSTSPAVHIGTGPLLPAYVNEMKALGVRSYTTYIADGHTEYIGKNKSRLDSDPCHNFIKIAESVNVEYFRLRLLFHLQGMIQSEQFCKDCGKSGIAKWKINIKERTCSYFCRKGTQHIVELIPNDSMEETN